MSLTGAQPAAVVVTESGVRKIKYNAKVYLDAPGDSAQMITKLTEQTKTTSFKEAQSLHGYTFSSIQAAYLDKSIPCGHASDAEVADINEKRRDQSSPRDTRLAPSRQLVSK